MSYTSMIFLFFLALTAAVYYLFPAKKYRWTVLLAASVLFYAYASFKFLFFILFTTLSVYFMARLIEDRAAKRKAFLSEKKAEWDKQQIKLYKQQTDRLKKRICTVGLIANFGILVFLKYYTFAAEALASVLKMPALSGTTLKIFMPLGISFYTFQATGYLIDVYRGNIQAQRSPAKLLLFLSFFPQIIQGPIDTYEHLGTQLVSEHSFEFENLRSGCELMLWGFLKKLVIADRAVAAINVVTADYAVFNGSVLLFTVLLYALQLYADFSGGIDISRGASQVLGIDMAENFRRPYFATSLNDYWRRWHITLGTWMKNYLFYPIALSKGARKLSLKICDTSFGKSKAGSHIGRSLPSCLATMVVFISVGLWHGSSSQYLLFGLWNGVIISLSILLQPLFAWQNGKLGINEESVLLRLFRILRTFIIVCISNITDLAPNIKACFDWFGRILADFDCTVGIVQIKEQLVLEDIDYIILSLGVVLVTAVSIMQEKKPDETIRARLNSRCIALRWAVLLAGIVAVLLIGQYGPGYDAAAFVYMQF